jgi:uncharacterized protein (TIGR01244 family)
MQRLFYGFFAGGLFGAGLLISGMVDTVKVQGWLDVFGDWDPTLAFVMGGAILPMAVAWRVAARRETSYLGFALPEPPKREVGPNLIIGSVLFGMGWALGGLCPGPSVASLSFGGAGGVIFLIAMAAGMFVAPAIRNRIDQGSAQRNHMEIRALTPTYAVSPQIEAADLPAIKAAGYTTIINNRPDGEITENLHAAQMQKQAEALGLTFVINPLIPGNFTPDNIAVQAAAVKGSAGPVFAYCASGNRCSIIWAMMNAGTIPADDLIAIPARFGYRLDHLRPQLVSRFRSFGGFDVSEAKPLD